MQARGFPMGELYHEVTDETSGGARPVLDLARPAGEQDGLSQPVSTLLNETSDTEGPPTRPATGSSLVLVFGCQ